MGRGETIAAALLPKHGGLDFDLHEHLTRVMMLSMAVQVKYVFLLYDTCTIVQAYCRYAVHYNIIFYATDKKKKRTKP